MAKKDETTKKDKVIKEGSFIYRFFAKFWEKRKKTQPDQK